MGASFRRVFRQASASTAIALAALLGGCDRPANSEVEHLPASAPEAPALQSLTPAECRALYSKPHAGLEARGLNAEEAKIVSHMFGGLLDPDKITMSAVGDFKEVAFAQPDEIGWRGDRLRDDYTTDKFWRGVFIHELTHLWQFASAPCNLDQKFQYAFTLTGQSSFHDLPTEAQADAVAIYAAYYFPPDDVVTFSVDNQLYNVLVQNGVAVLDTDKDEALKAAALAAHAPQRFIVYTGSGGVTPDPLQLARVVEGQFPLLAEGRAVQEARWKLAESALLRHMAELVTPPAPQTAVAKNTARNPAPHI
ncbi:MAG: hypothetical protein PW788_02975 [Micavibrio sp.]|nr:hypothetical protein [Micavibrio sp.]